MTLLIWILAVFFMGFWSLLAWLSYALLQWAGQLPWDQTLQRVKELPVPAVVAPWWQDMVNALDPILHMASDLLQWLVQFAGAALPFIVGVIWFVGTMLILLVAAAATGGVWWFNRKKRVNT